MFQIKRHHHAQFVVFFSDSKINATDPWSVGMLAHETSETYNYHKSSDARLTLDLDASNCNSYHNIHTTVLSNKVSRRVIETQFTL